MRAVLLYAATLLSILATNSTLVLGQAAPGDFDGDATISLEDHRALIDCLEGPETAPLGERCAIGDFDCDGDADLRDWRWFQNFFESTAPLVNPDQPDRDGDGMSDACPTCGEVVGDRAAVANVWFTAATACPCDSATSNDEYVACVRAVSEAAVADWVLPIRCRSTVAEASAQSVCGRSEGAVTCCRDSATGEKSCTVVLFANECQAPKDGTATVGASGSCYDACLPGLTGLAITEAEANSAASVAVNEIVDPWGADFGLVLARAAAELGARVETVPVPGAQQAQVASPTDCLHTQCPGFYCGNWNPNLNPWPVGPCLNRACFNHDLCSFQACVRPDPHPCYFSPQSAACDIALFDACRTCLLPDVGFMGIDLLICAVAGFLELTPRGPGCECPACKSGPLCDQETGVCSPSTGTCCGNGLLDSGEECDDGNLVNGDGCTATCAVEDCNDNIDCTGDEYRQGVGCVHTPDDALCDDWQMWNGRELCDSNLGCLRGPPLGCAPNCPFAWIGDGICDYSCLNPQCQYDGDDCDECSPGCFLADLKNGFCTAWCGTPACDWDADDCPQCSAGCRTDYDLGDAHCQQACYNEACDWGGGDCPYRCGEGCPPGYCQLIWNGSDFECVEACASWCLPEFVGDGICHGDCMVPWCDFDGGDCDCSGFSCFPAWIGDGLCNDSCLNDECNWDGGDCEECAPGCPGGAIDLLGCYYPCFNELCGWSGGKCKECSVGCFPSWVGDALCEDACFNETCAWDGGDCDLSTEYLSRRDDSARRTVFSRSSPSRRDAFRASVSLHKREGDRPEVRIARD